MVEIKIFLRRKVEQEWFKDLANVVRDDFGDSGTWKPSEEGYVWTHSRHRGKVRFLKQYDGEADYAKIWNPEKGRFNQAQALADFIQWAHHRASDYIKRIEIPITQA
jgi:hypothetical protein